MHSIKKIITNTHRLSRQNRLRVKISNKIKLRSRIRHINSNRTKCDLFLKNNKAYMVTGPLPNNLDDLSDGPGHRSPKKQKRCPYCGRILPKNW